MIRYCIACAALAGLGLAPASATELDEFLGGWEVVGQNCATSEQRLEDEGFSYFYIERKGYSVGGFMFCGPQYTVSGNDLTIRGECGDMADQESTIDITYSLAGGVLVDERGVRYERCLDERGVQEFFCDATFQDSMFAMTDVMSMMEESYEERDAVTVCRLQEELMDSMEFALDDLRTQGCRGPLKDMAENLDSERRNHEQHCQPGAEHLPQ